MFESKHLNAFLILVCTIIFFGSAFVPMPTVMHIYCMCVFGIYGLCLIGLGILDIIHENKNKK